MDSRRFIPSPKVVELFEYRLIPWLIKKSNLAASFIDQLYVLQTCIYELDKYIEMHWELNPMQISKLWHSVEMLLADFGYRPEHIRELLRSFQIYFDREQNLRAGHFPSYIAIEDFYFHKSCDVKLHRQIIADKAHIEPVTRHDWEVFDLITEINDDIADLSEDAATFNGNRLLISLNLGDEQATFQEYLSLIRSLKERVLTIENQRIRTLATQEGQNALIKIETLIKNYDKVRSLYFLPYLQKLES